MRPSSDIPPALVLVFLCWFSWLSWAPLAAVGRTTVTRLPGFHGPLPFKLETGYVTVDESNDAKLFYYFIESEGDPSEDPVLVWLTGGPGCSGFTSLAFEIGPLSFDVAAYEGGISLPTLVYRPDSWTKVSNIIFIDSSVGAGFSYSTSLKDYESGDLKSARQVYSFIRKWFADHPQFLSNPLYIAGDSYSGITLPIVTQEIANGIQAGDKPHLNLKGYSLGNPLTDYEVDHGARVPYVHRVGLISDELYEATKKSCDGEYASPVNPLCTNYIQSVEECLRGINEYHILEPVCFPSTPKPNHHAVDRRSLEEHAEVIHLSETRLPLECRSSGYLLSYFWANRDAVRDALGVHKGTVSYWRRCPFATIPYKSDVHSTVIYHLDLTTRGYRALVYSGDHDVTVPYLGTQAWIRSLNISIVDDWRPWSVDGQVAGFTRTYSNNLTFATVLGGGHTAPEYRPKQCLAMVKRWLSNRSL